MSDYIGTDDIAQLTGLKRTYVTDKLVKQPDFPPPAIRLSQKIKRWDRVEVDRWLEQKRRKIRGR